MQNFFFTAMSLDAHKDNIQNPSQNSASGDYIGTGDGICDTNEECDGVLVCGKENCSWAEGDDCCRKPREGEHCHEDVDCEDPLVCDTGHCQKSKCPTMAGILIEQSA